MPGGGTRRDLVAQRRQGTPPGGGTKLDLVFRSLLDTARAVKRKVTNDPTAVMVYGSNVIMSYYYPNAPEEMIHFITGIGATTTTIAASAMANWIAQILAELSAKEAEVYARWANVIFPIVTAVAGALAKHAATGGATGVADVAMAAATIGPAAVAAIKTPAPVPNSLSANKAAARRLQQDRVQLINSFAFRNADAQNRREVERARLAADQERFRLTLAQKGQAESYRRQMAEEKRREGTFKELGTGLSNAFSTYSSAAALTASIAQYNNQMFVTFLSYGVAAICILFDLYPRIENFFMRAKKTMNPALLCLLQLVAYQAGAMLCMGALNVGLAWTLGGTPESIKLPVTEARYAAAEGYMQEVQAALTKLETDYKGIATKPNLPCERYVMVPSLLKMITFLKTIDAMVVPSVMRTLASKGIIEAPLTVVERPFSETDAEGGTLLSSIGNIDVYKAVKKLQEMEIDSDILFPSIEKQRTGIEHDYSGTSLINAALKDAASKPLFKSTDSFAGAYRFCSIEEYESMTGLVWPKTTLFRNYYLPKGAADGIVISTLLPDSPLEPVISGIGYVFKGQEDEFGRAGQDLVTQVFGGRDSPSVIPYFRWSMPTVPRILGDLPNSWQLKIVEDAVYLRPIRYVQEWAFGDDASSNLVIRFAKAFAGILFVKSLVYGMFSTGCLKIERRLVAYPPQRGGPSELEVNVLLWKAWNILRPSDSPDPGEWQSEDSLAGLLDHNTRTAPKSREFQRAFSNFAGTFSRKNKDVKKGMMRSLLRLDPIDDRDTELCRYALYLLIPDEDRGLLDVNIGSMHASITCRGPPGRCRQCGADAVNVKWLVKEDDPGIRVIALWNLPSPGDTNVNDDQTIDDVAELKLSSDTKIGCIRCYEDDAKMLIEKAGNQEEKERIKEAFAKGYRRR